MSLWICSTCGHSSENNDLLQEHLRQVHQSSMENDAPIEERRILRDLSNQECPFCGEIPGATKFVGHVCHHLEEISLSAVPNEEEDLDEDAEEESSRNPLTLSSMSSRIEDQGVTFSDELNAPQPPAGRTKEQILLEMQEKARKAAEADKAEKLLEEEELERQIREMEDAEAEREKKEAEKLAKRASEKARADKEEADCNERKLREAEREMERLEDEREKKRAEAEAAELKNKPGSMDKEKKAPYSPGTLHSKLSSLTLGTDSETSINAE
jgi:flagellar biosynthesis GTPase FlhF